jgi:hypothetical protein
MCRAAAGRWGDPRDLLALVTVLAQRVDQLDQALEQCLVHAGAGGLGEVLNNSWV